MGFEGVPQVSSFAAALDGYLTVQILRGVV